MGVKGLREAFNSVAQPAATCTLALLDYARDRIGKEVQVLRFSGIEQSGKQFQITSRQIRPNEDILQAAAETAQMLLDSSKP